MPKARKTTVTKAKTGTATARSTAGKRGRKALKDIENEDREDRGADNRVVKKTRRGKAIDAVVEVSTTFCETC